MGAALFMSHNQGRAIWGSEAASTLGCNDYDGWSSEDGVNKAKLGL